MGTGQYDRILVVIGEDNELPVNWTMVITGNAHHYDYGDSAGDPCLTQAQKTAQAAYAGLWRDRNPITPQEWRNSND